MEQISAQLLALPNTLSLVLWSTAADSICSFNFQMLLKSWSLESLEQLGKAA